MPTVYRKVDGLIQQCHKAFAGACEDLIRGLDRESPSHVKNGMDMLERSGLLTNDAIAELEAANDSIARQSR